MNDFIIRLRIKFEDNISEMIITEYCEADYFNEAIKEGLQKAINGLCNLNILDKVVSINIISK